MSVQKVISIDVDNRSNSSETTDLIDIRSYPVKDVLPILLQDKTTKKNIIWATDAYVEYCKNCKDTSHISTDVFFMGKPIPLQPRIEKSIETQQERTRSKAEVFTPIWICNRMANHFDEEWFDRKNVFNRENEDHTWTVTESKIVFPEGKGWMDYVDSRRLEITCGEAPFLVSRYDTATGEFIVPPKRRIGLLDRKIRIVNENAKDVDEWKKWTLRAYQSCYGYEWQGDSLLIARVNLLMTYYEYYVDKWSTEPDESSLSEIANVIAWNIWQMDGSKDVVPFGKPYENHVQKTLFDSFEPSTKTTEDVALPCKITDWRNKNSLKFKECKSRGKMKKKMFDFVIGNPPYQEEFSDEGNKTYAAPVYNIFMDAAYEVGTAVELIHPARFLFNAGSTPKIWNEKMLNDAHFKILEYTECSSTIFINTDIKGGLVISYRDENHKCQPIRVFTKYTELNTLLPKLEKEESIISIIYIQNRFDLKTLLAEHPEYRKSIGGEGRDSRFEKNIFEKIPLFVEKCFDDSIKTIGIHHNKRTWMYIDSKYVDSNHENLSKFKLIIPVANGNGKYGEELSDPIVLSPNEAYTRSFIGIGAFENKIEADNVMKYIKTKFVRSLLSILKVTQMTNRDVWLHVPIQNFTNKSDIIWSKSINDIDKQLYRKYKLSTEEIEFIETHVQEMN